MVSLYDRLDGIDDCMVGTSITIVGPSRIIGLRLLLMFLNTLACIKFNRF